MLSVVLCCLTLVPIANVLSTQGLDGKHWWKRQFLYNMDFMSRWLSRALYPIGISTDPEQVVVGREGWLYLGDQYEESRTVTRRGQTPAEVDAGQRIGAATLAWERWLAGKGVRLFRVMIAPNKETIYPEYLPAWAKPSLARPTATDALLAGTGTERWIDLRPALLSAKTSNRDELYYHVDHHWNSLAAAIAFRAFAREVGRSLPELRWPTDSAIEVKGFAQRKGGDLANFLRMADYLQDLEPSVVAPELAIETTQSDFDSGVIISRGGNPPVGSPDKPLLVSSVGALNNNRVLWLRDSFGVSLSPMMAATFSETLQLHWLAALKPGGRFAELVEKWKPDYVFVTVVERLSRYKFFAAYPPVSVIEQRPGFTLVRTTIPVELHGVSHGSAPGEYRSTGPDPFVVYELAAPILAREASFLSVGLSCGDNAGKVPIQLFWLSDEKPYFDEERSVKFVLDPGVRLIDLHTIPGWTEKGSVRRLRLDIDSTNVCLDFNLSDPTLVEMR